MTDNRDSDRPGRVAPSSPEAEEAVLGSILLNPDTLLDVASFLQAGDFFIVRNGWIFDAMLSLHERGEAIDELTLIRELRTRDQLDTIGGPSYITSLINNTPTFAHAETYARLIERAAIRRRLLTAASEIAQIALEENAPINEVIDKAESTLFGVTEQRLKRDVVPIRFALSDYFDRIEYLYNHRDEPLGLPTGFTDLDKLLGGLQKSDLCIVAARPGVGKTSFMLSIAINAARFGTARVAIFSMEMSNEQLVQRFVAAETGINSQKLRLGNIDEREWGLFVEATGKLGNLRVYMDETPAITVTQMRTKCRRMYREHGLDLVIVDYLQLMTSDMTRHENRVQEIGEISRNLKQLARELNVPVLAASQLSRAVEQRADKRPQLSDLRESGCLTGDTLIYLPDTGRYVPIAQLCGDSGFRVMSLNTETWKLEPGTVTNAFCTGIKPVYRLTTRLGRTIRATANHKFLTLEGWKRLDELAVREEIAGFTEFTSPPVRDRFAVPAAGREGESASSVLTLGDRFRLGSQLDKQYSTTSTGKSNLPLSTYSPSLLAERGAGGEAEWDAIHSIEPDALEKVYDLTVDDFHNFCADGLIVHNSIEQDADIVTFLYRDDLYNEASDRPNQADVIVAKNRNGPTGVITLFFKKELTQFVNMAKSNINLQNF